MSEDDASGDDEPIITAPPLAKAPLKSGPAPTSASSSKSKSVKPGKAKQTAPEPEPGLLSAVDGIVRPILNLGASPPPTFLKAKNPSPECTNINQGELMCCRGTVAGDQQVVVWLAKLYGYNLNPNDINGLNCEFTS